ncbi:hypothetical protein [Nakamurella sp.]|uniref:hypothetical protein n=1 Tax=Nakamurella sp. TaxID=1869182 RepID=UPI003B3BCD0A
MRVESVIAVPASDTVGPTRLRLLTARTGKLPVVVVADGPSGPEYHVLTMAELQAAMTNQLSATPLAEVLDLAGRSATVPIGRGEVQAAAVGTPVVDNGRLVGVVLDDKLELPEPTEQDLERGAPSTRGPAAEAAGDAPRKRGLWGRLTGSGS